MSNSNHDRAIPEGDPRTPSSSSHAPARNPPLVIVSERGRHSEESRRIVRAQAARASAAQSRETRARNREDRHHRDGPQSPTESAANPPPQSQPPSRPRLQQPQQAPVTYTAHHATYTPSGLPESHQTLGQTSQQNAEQQSSGRLEPLVNWVNDILRHSARSFAAGAASLASTGMPPLANASDVLFRAGGILSDSGHPMEEVQITGDTFNRRLPIALPRGFVALQQRIQISDAFLVLLSRTACFDFGSPGVEGRLNGLLYDIVMTSADATVATSGISSHPIEGHLRIACTCLTIFQGQRADGQTFAHDQNYHNGLEAAWQEVMALDQDALKEPKSAEAALWAVYIINVTCGSAVTFFQRLLFGLMQDLQLHQWDDVRAILLDFIYPGSFLDEPCKNFFDQLHVAERNQAVYS